MAKLGIVRLGVAMALFAGEAEPAAAQTGGAGGRTSYDAAYFQQFAPSTALQIVEHVPGFTLDSGNQDLRGFGQTAGNVVINGQRPSSKSDTLDTILARIPANRVARVEIGPGDLFGSEFLGKPQVVNLILTSTGGIAGTVEGTLRRSFSGQLIPIGSVSALTKRGRSTFNASISHTHASSDEEGYDTLQSLPDRALIERRTKFNHIREPGTAIAASWEYDDGVNRTAHINGKASLDKFVLTQENHVVPAMGIVRDDLLTERYRTRTYELGGDVTRPWLGGGIKLVGLLTRRHRLNKDLSLNRIDGDVLGGFAQDLDDDKEESVLRIVWNRGDWNGWSVETGAEGVINRLRSNVDLFTIDDAGDRQIVDLPIGDAVVNEHRAEVFINAGRPIAPRMRLDFGLTWEGSRLIVTGDAEAERFLKFFKPKASLDWRSNNNWHVQLSVSRTVAQLQFEDFISVAELSNDRVNGGNANLLPERAWEFLATIERPILGDGLIKLEAGYTLVSQVQDRVPTPEGFDAPGNLGNGKKYILRNTFDVPLARLGIKGGRFTAHSKLNITSVEDPYTHRNRHFTAFNLWVWDVNFRQDLGKFAWGFGLSSNSDTVYYRRDEIDRTKEEAPYVTAFAEYRPSQRTTLTLGLDNATGAPVTRERTFFDPDRSNPNPSLFEYRKRNIHILPYVTLKHSFG